MAKNGKKDNLPPKPGSSKVGKPLTLKRKINGGTKRKGGSKPETPPNPDTPPNRKTARSQESQAVEGWDDGGFDTTGWDADNTLNQENKNANQVEAEAASTFEASETAQPTADTNKFGQATVTQTSSSKGRAYTKFDGDQPRKGAEDRLGITPDVEAFAELICLKETRPPLSIGLFGDWGSGKSFFMQKLSETIKNLAARGAEDKEGLFVSNVVQIKFNAWHYADANLWASLTADFMNHLRAGGAGDTRKYDYSLLIDELAARVSHAEAEQSKVAEHTRKLKDRIAAKSTEIAALENQKEGVAAKLFEEAAMVNLDAFFDANNARVDEAGRALGYPELSKDIEKFRKEARDAMELSGRLWAFARGLGHARGWDVLFVIGAIVLAIVTAGLFWSDVAPLVMDFVPLLASAGMLIAAVWRTVRKILPILNAANRYARDVKARREEIDRSLTAEIKALHRLKKESAEAEIRRSEQQVFVERYQAGAAGDSPAALLHYFLHESEETRQFEQHLGIVSRVRRAFVQLEALLSKPEPERDEADMGNGSPARIDRIVLYIDDLDRCRDQQVVEVLEAVQLLLAFEHIVVVVGVDARWLEHSLKSFYKDKLTSANTSVDGRASVIDYLEKIFQIPFWLRPLTYGDSDGEGTYEKLVAGIVGTKAEIAAVPSPNHTPPTEVAESDEDTRIRMNLEVREIELLKKLGPLAGRSPRAVTRILNVYRLIRVRRSGQNLERFLGHDGNPPEFPAIMFLLALDAGLRPAEATTVHKVLVSLEEDVNVRLLDEIMRTGESIESDAQAREAQPLLWPVVDRVASAISAVEASLGQNLYRKDLDDALQEVGRYSFRHRELRRQG